MKHVVLGLLAVLMVVGISFAEHSHDGMNMKSHEMKHDVMSGMGKLVFKGESKGVKVRGYLNDMESAMKSMMKDKNIKMDMSKMDPNLTHHISFMIDGNVKSATIKLEFKGVSKEYVLMSMSGHYGSDISLKEKGTYKAKLIVDTETSGKLTFSFNLKN